MVVRVDEAHHRDVNHFALDIHYQGSELKKIAALGTNIGFLK